MSVEVEELLFEMIKIESHQETEGHEQRFAEFLKDYLEKEGVVVELREVVDGRCNLIATVEGDDPGPVLMLNGHMDTVPPYDMEHPFQPYLENGRIYGRGSVDMKGALAAMTVVTKDIYQNRENMRGTLLFTATIGEENYSPGAYELVKDGVRADYAIVGEPTNMEIGIAHKGVVWGEAIFEGEAVHGSTPFKGINAIYKATDWIQKVRRDYLPRIRQNRHALLGESTMNIGEISGGTRPVIVPARCEVKFEQRLLPGEKESDVIDGLQQMIEELKQEDPEMKGVVHESAVFNGVPHRSLETDSNSRIVHSLKRAYSKEFDQDTEVIGLGFWTDGALFGEVDGVDVVVCGPGDIAQAHSDNEFIDRDQLQAAYRMYYDVVTDVCK
ncbi:M20 family metallopeptidase [Salimicrobium halophilum]|uniref:Probable succinyl-diaminopimelate desuccinylase n=1 Tax=Salimicrobium halophilum TaxID=86666 RepID=A0A1G8SC27_9BACI|nr:M20 family metallopeptidase [Salimicrobium halophilum]SDJ26305.1 succinyl-diaminopimelate desuccinylase [Salimicrobium halophilum]